MRELAVAAPAIWIALGVGVGACARGTSGAAGATGARSAASGVGPRKEAIVCPHDASAAAGTCRCKPGLAVLEGACVGPREIEAYCGAPAPGAPATAACATTACAKGEPVDAETGACVPERLARAVVARTRPIPEDLTLACHEGDSLVVHADEVVCLPTAATCPRTTVWDAATARCATVPACAPGEVGGEPAFGSQTRPACLQVVTGTAAGGLALLDVGRWARQMIGADRGLGTSRLCQPFVEHPWALDVGTGGARVLALAIELRFPDNDVTQVSGSVEVTDAASGQLLAGLGGGGQRGQRAEQALDTLLIPLRALGGVSDAASATLQVRCTVRGGGTPFLDPRESP